MKNKKMLLFLTIMIISLIIGVSYAFFNYVRTGSSNVLRIESLDDCCCTCRILYPSTSEEGQYLSTNQFVTIDLNCCGAIRCLNDTYVDLC